MLWLNFQNSFSLLYLIIWLNKIVFLAVLCSLQISEISLMNPGEFFVKHNFTTVVSCSTYSYILSIFAFMNRKCAYIYTWKWSDFPRIIFIFLGNFLRHTLYAVETRYNSIHSVSDMKPK